MCGPPAAGLHPLLGTRTSRPPFAGLTAWQTPVDTLGVQGAVACLRRGGRLAAISPMVPDQLALDEAGITVWFVVVEPDHAALESVAEMLVAGTLRVVIGEQRPLPGGPPGKLVAIV